MKNKLETITNVCLLTVTIFVAGLICYRQFFTGKPNLGHQLVGQSVDAKTFGPKDGERAMVILMSTNCKYCALSIGFYRQIADRTSGRNITVAFLQSEQEARRYLRDNHVEIKNVVGSTNLIQQIPTTPAIVLIDKSGKIVNAWVGRLPPEKEKEVLKKLPL